MKTRLLVVLLCFFGAELYAQAPGNVSTNLRWWLKANAGTFTDNGTTAATNNQAVQQWSDQSLILNHARQATLANKPIYRTNIFNGNPVLTFDTDQFLDQLAVPGIGPTNSMYMFLVFRQNSFVAGGTGDGSGTYIVDRTTATSNLASFKMVNTDKYYYQKRNDANASLTGPVSVTSAQNNTIGIVSYFRNFNVSYGININGRTDATSGGDGDNITGPAIRLGRHTSTTNGGLDGDLAEVILYNSILTNAERLRVESYLAIKYGVTLDQTVSTDYVNSAGITIYPATLTSHDAYDNNIAGIGRDDLSGLNQVASQSSNPGSIVRIFNPGSMVNDEFLLWGNDAPTIWNSTDIPAPYINRISRIWRVFERGDVGTFSISFDLSGLGMDMTDATKFALLVDGDGIFNNATAITTGRAIAGNVVTFTGASITTGQFFSLASSLIPGPGGVAATTVWLRADELVYNNAGTTLATNGQTVQQWQTSGGVTSANATQGTGGNRPTFVTGAANNNPVVRFATTRFLDFGASLGVSSTSDLSMTMAFRPTTVATGTTANTAGGYLFDRTTNTTALTSLKFTTGNTVGFQERTNAGALDGPVTTSSVSTSAMQIVDFYRDYSVRFGIFFNGAQEAILAEAGGALAFPTPRIGASQAGSGGLDGDIAEYIFYTRDITTAERNRIDSYLAIKYGITLNQVSLTNYTASNGAIVYPAASSHSGYISDIAGIGRDAVSRLVQTNSKSMNTGAVVQMQNPSGLADLEFLIWGDDAGSLTSPTASGTDGVVIKRRLSRIWKVAETGEVGTVDISFDLTNVPGAKVQADLRMMIDQDHDGFADNDVVPKTGTLAGQIFTVTGVDLEPDDLFTIGTTNITSTPLPIQLLSFDVSLEKSGVVANWRTANEINNDYFTLERSVDGEKFKEAIRVPGAGTTSDTRYYEAMDNPRTQGIVYYRLKQTDFDGKTSYSAVRKVTLESVPFFANLYPNPAAKGEFTIELPLEAGVSSMVVLNSAGQVVFTGSSTEPVSKWKVSELPAGIYFVKVLTGMGATAMKLVIQ
ncbi:MAG TPA: T9SS type A sorting domain-containing protein [Cyclobacteriaceae bacterium]|nr:T9SS type A sorting domain-containing protein [Cyclobacteriaceae bacterium]